MTETGNYIFFWGSIYSNWYPCKFRHIGPTGELFNCSEQAFMYEKAEMFGDLWHRKLILEATDPEEQKRLGRQVEGFKEEHWAKHRYKVMVDVNLDKFRQNPILKSALLNTGEKIIVEASPEDRIWGIGLAPNDPRCLDESKWKGQNLLGKALMEVREILRKEENEIRSCK